MFHKSGAISSAVPIGFLPSTDKGATFTPSELFGGSRTKRGPLIDSGITLPIAAQTGYGSSVIVVVIIITI